MYTHNEYLPSLIKSFKVGVISFTDPRQEVQFTTAREEFIKKQHNLLVEKIRKQGFNVIDPLKYLDEKIKERKVWGINSNEYFSDIISLLIKEDIGALIFGCFAWNEPNIPLEFGKKINVPIALVTTADPNWPGITALASTGASFWESSYNSFIKNHERYIVSIPQEFNNLISWLSATRALYFLKNGKLLLWGGTPALNMEHLNDDIPTLKKFIINDIITEDQFVLINKSEQIIREDSSRITNYLNFLENNSCNIFYDNKMTTKEIIKKQIALYLAAKDLINERLIKNERIIGVSVKCQPEISVYYGITPCMIPAFLPFNSDPVGPKYNIQTVCEGDIKGLISSLLLYGLNPEVPSLFGDLKIINDKYFIISNCGAASIFYAKNSNDLLQAISNIQLKPQCQGASGAAVSFHTPPSKESVTYTRLIRLAGKYYLQVGLGKIIQIEEKKYESWGTTWPQTAIELKVPKEYFMKAIGTNHLSLTLGNYINEFAYISKILNIEIVRLDDIKSIEKFLDKIKK